MAAIYFQMLPSLDSARARLMEGGGEKIVEDVFRPFFLKHSMDRRFGLQIAHRHCDIEPDEKLVHYDNIAIPWKAVTSMSEPLPVVWAFFNGQRHAVEFRYSRESKALGSTDIAFMDAFARLQADAGVPDLFALCEYPGDSFPGSCEFTQNRCNINLKPQDYPDDLVAVNTTWFFEDRLWKRGCRCKCDNRTKDHGHGGHVITAKG